MGNGALKDLFADILTLAHHQSIAEIWCPQGWDLILRRDLNDWEMNILIDLFKQPISSHDYRMGRARRIGKDITVEDSKLMQLIKQ